MEYWNRIDLHQHTNHDIDCTGKSADNNYTHLDYYKWLEEENVKLKAVTCHNNIDISSHIKHAIISDLLGINHLVGVEIDYKFDKLEFHAITILSPNVDVIKFAKKLEDIRISKGNNIYFSKDDFCDLHTDIEFIFIPHAIKDKGILEQKLGDLEKETLDWVVKSLISGVGEPILFENTKDYHMYRTKTCGELNLKNVEIEISAYVGDDYRFDNDEKRKEIIKNKIKYSINSQPTYRGLEIALRNSNTRLSLETQIINRERFIKRISIPQNRVFEESDIFLSPGLNVIIGNSGSGKTLLLNEIFYEIKRKNLKAAIKNKTKENGNEYKSKVGEKDFLDIEFDQVIDSNDIKILEIPNVYSEILKSQNDENQEIPKMFGIDDVSHSNRIISEYKINIEEYIKNQNMGNIAIKNGVQNLNNIKTAIDFLYKNKTDIKIFNLNKILYNEAKINSVFNKSQDINKYILDEKKINKYFEKIKEIISFDSGKEEVDNLLSDYKKILISLGKELELNEKKYNELLIDKKIINIINSSIDSSIQLLGNKDKKIKEREQILSKETNELIESLKKSIISDLNINNYKLGFPYEDLKQELEKNRNDYARLTLNITEEDIKKTVILESKLFNCNNIRTKLKELGNKKYNLLEDGDVKKLISDLNSFGIDLTNIILDANEIPKNIELYLSDKNEWRFIQNINKGDIAKKSIEYHFNKLVKDNQPDIILIDQPENDVDKSFISTTLSDFIKKQKVDKQIIVTSHDAIVAINSDVNKIIEADINDNNKIFYHSYDLEYVENEVLVATNQVAIILDGGKTNIKKRYQIYGGELNYENRNI